MLLLVLLLLQALTEPNRLFGVCFQDPVMLFFAALLVPSKEWLTNIFGLVVFLNAVERFGLLLFAIRNLFGSGNFRRLTTRC
jgi:hypothetical protein